MEQILELGPINILNQISEPGVNGNKLRIFQVDYRYNLDVIYDGNFLECKYNLEKVDGSQNWIFLHKRW